VIVELPEETAAVYRRAEKELLLAERPEATLHDRAAIERLLPHRGPMLLVDRITHVDRQAGAIVARYDLSRASAIFAGHFPARPMYPGVLHVEAVGQAGMLYKLLADGEPVDRVAMTQILAGRFVRQVRPGGELEIVAVPVDDGLFLTVVGQCLQDGELCSTVALRGLPGG
jgi:3-hydroxymyristoyl/3-hydroxydecanoyl-(acyl carrier protein) dehydratase